MAQTTRKRILANPAPRRKMSAKQAAIFGRTPAIRAAAKARIRNGRTNGKSRKKHSHKKPAKSNPGGKLIGFTLGQKNNPAGKRNMPTKKAKSRKKKSSGYGKSNYKRNPPAKKNSGHRPRSKRRNPGDMGNISGIVTNAVFVIVGALGSKLGAQAVLGSNNTGVIGYVGNAAVGAALWLLTEKVMKNRAAASGVIAGTVVQILLRAINDFTPFGSYVQQLGMGDYQMQSWVTPQVLVDPWNSAQIAVPPGWAPTTVMAPPAAANGAPAGRPALPAAAAAAGNGSGMGDYAYGNDLYGGGRATALY